MKIVIRLLLTATLLMPTLASAELIIYKGTRSDTFNGQGQKGTVKTKLILIVDYQNVQASAIVYSTKNNNGPKFFQVSPLPGPHFVQVRGASGNYSAIARTSLQCEIDAGATGEGIYFKGKDATLTLNDKVSVSFPKIMNGHFDDSIVYSKITEQPAFRQGAWKVAFDSAGTLKSNQAEETSDDAVARYSDELESLGYVQQ